MCTQNVASHPLANVTPIYTRMMKFPGQCVLLIQLPDKRILTLGRCAHGDNSARTVRPDRLFRQALLCDCVREGEYVCMPV